MKFKRLALVCAIAALALPALAFAGGKPPEGADYMAPGGTTAAQTEADKDSNKVAEKIDISVGIYGCGNNVPFMVEGLAIKKRNGDYVYRYKGKTKNLAGQKFDLKVKGKFKSAKKIVEKATVSKGNCSESEKFKLKKV